MQQKGFGLLSLMIAMFLFTAIAISDDSSTNQGSQETGETINLGEISIQAQKLKDNIELSPEKININLDNYQKAGTPHSIIDILKDRAIIDFRGRSGLTNENEASFIFQLTLFLYDLSYVETHGSASLSRERANIFWFLISKN
jgi:iron complex outermembrane receptor protein